MLGQSKKSMSGLGVRHTSEKTRKATNRRRKNQANLIYKAIALWKKTKRAVNPLDKTYSDQMK